MSLTKRRPRVLLGSTGSVASIKVAALCEILLEFADVKLMVTSSAKNFINEDELPEAVNPVLGDEAEWRHWRAVGDPVLHIELRRWADLLLVAPLSANTLAKMANGLADNLLTCVVRAWDFAKPLVVAPAMNTAMWVSPFTSRHLDTLTQLGATSTLNDTLAHASADAVDDTDSAKTNPAAVAITTTTTSATTTSTNANDSTAGGYPSPGPIPKPGAVPLRCSFLIVPPVSKRLACGDEGTGAMASPQDIAAQCRQVLQSRGLLLPVA